MSASNGHTYAVAGGGRAGTGAAGFRTGGRPIDFDAPKPELVRRSPGVRRAPRSRPTRTPRSTHGPPDRLPTKDEDDPDDLIAALAAAISERGPASATTLARQLKRRTTLVLEALHSSRFVRRGRGRDDLGSRRLQRLRRGRPLGQPRTHRVAFVQRGRLRRARPRLARQGKRPACRHRARRRHCLARRLDSA
jgi:hypothetical protein